MKNYLPSILLALMPMLSYGSNIEPLNYKFIKEVDFPNKEPVKVYELHASSSVNPGPTVMVIKTLNDVFKEFPVYLESDGTLRAPDRKQPFFFTLRGGYGESFQFILVSEENGNVTPLGKCTITPFPLVAEDNQGHKLELIAADPSGEQFSVKVSGFTPNEEIVIKSRSCHEEMAYTIHADEAGKIYMGFAPAVVGKTEGPFSFSLSNAKMKPLTINHYWGKIAFTRPNKYKALKEKYSY